MTPIDTATNTPGEPIEVGVRPRAIAITPDGKTAYVVNQSRPQPPPWHSYEAEKRGLPQPPPDSRGTVTPIDTATNTPGEPIDAGNEPFAIAVTPDGKTVYVVNTWENTGRPANGPGTVTPIATATNTPGPPIQVGSARGRSPSPRTARPPTSSTSVEFGDADRDRDQHAGPADPGRQGTAGDRDHAGRQDRLCRQLAGRYGDADRDRDQHRGRADPGRRGSPGDRDHARTARPPTSASGASRAWWCRSRLRPTRRDRRSRSATDHTRSRSRPEPAVFELPACGVARRAPGGASQGQSPALTPGQRRRKAPP